MDDQHKHIEDWLKAAAQQPVPDDTGMEAKQQAWSKMAGLLDNAAVPVPAQEPSPLPKPWFATGQGMLWLAAAAAAVGLIALVVYLQVNRHQTTENKDLQRVVHENVSTVTADDTLNAEAAGNNGEATVYGSTENDTMDEDNRGAALNGEGDVNGDDSWKGSYGLPLGAGSLVTQVAPQGNKLWSDVTADAKKRTGEKGRDAAVKEPDTALASNNFTAKSTLPAEERSASKNTNYNKTSQPVNQRLNVNNGEINNKPGNLPTAGKNTDLAAANTPGRSAANNSKAPKTSGGDSGKGSTGKTKPGGIINVPQPSGGDSGEGNAGKTKPGNVIKSQPSGGVSGKETTPGKIKPGLAKAPNTSHPDNTNKTQPSILSPTYTNQKGKTPFAIKNATGTPNTIVLQPLRTVNAFSIRLPALPLNNREQQVGFMGGGFGDLVNNPEAVTGGLALQAGFVYPLSIGVAAGDSGTTKPGNGLGFKLGASYAFPIARGLYLQPILSASYLTGFGKTFSHTAVNRKEETDSAGAASGRYKTDSITTPYTVKSTFVGGAGVNVAYVINKWIFSTGLTYQYALPSGTKSTPETRSHTDSLQSIPVGNTPAFSKQQLPGMHTLSWSLDAGYYIRPRIQVGVSYRAILLRSAGNSGFAKPVQPLQDKQLEFYIRVPLRR